MLDKSLIAVSLLYSTALFGDDLPDSSHYEARLSGFENQVTLLEEKKANGNVGVIQSFQRPVHRDTGTILEADALFWKAEQEGFEYAVESPDLFQSGQLHKGRLLTHDFTWNGGFRLGVGYHLPYDRWDIKLLWTYYTNSSRDSKSHSTPKLSPVPFLFTSMSWFATHAKTHYSIHYNTLDLTLQREYFVGRSLSLRPVFGLRGAWINQHMNEKFSGGPFAIGVFGDQSGKQVVKFSNDFTSGGILGGINLNFFIDRHWSLYGDIAGSLLYGEFSVQMKNKITGTNFYGVKTSSKIKSDFNKIRANVETGLGFQWESLISHDRLRVLLSLGYEILFWFNQNNTQRFTSPGVSNNAYSDSNGNLTLQGGTFRAVVEF